MQFVISSIYTPLDSEHGQCVAPTKLAMPHLAQVIFDLVPKLIFHQLYIPEDTLHGIFTLAKDFRVMIPTRGHMFTLPLLGVVNPLLATQSPLNTLSYTRLSSKERPQRSNMDRGHPNITSNSLNDNSIKSPGNSYSHILMGQSM